MKDRIVRAFTRAKAKLGSLRGTLLGSHDQATASSPKN
jgi:hypothetical protein